MSEFLEKRKLTYNEGSDKEKHQRKDVAEMLELQEQPEASWEGDGKEKFQREDLAETGSRRFKYWLERNRARVMDEEELKRVLEETKEFYYCWGLDKVEERKDFIM